MDLSVVWSVHNLCNYKCSYCPPYNSSATENWLNGENVFNFIDVLKAHYFGRLSFARARFSLTGGEPTLWKELPEFCQKLKDNNMTVGITSNGSTPIAKWELFAHNLEWLCLSYHPQEVNEDRFFALLKFFHDRSDLALPVIRFMMHSDEALWRQSLNFAEKVRHSFANWAMEFVRIENSFGPGMVPVEYTKMQLEFLASIGYQEQRAQPKLIRKVTNGKKMDITFDNGDIELLRPNDLINSGDINFKDWSCHAGLESLMIHPTGRITRAGCDVGGELGWLQKPLEIKFPTDPIQCQVNRCWCSSDVAVTKFAPGI